MNLALTFTLAQLSRVFYFQLGVHWLKHFKSPFSDEPLRMKHEDVKFVEL